MKAILLICLLVSASLAYGRLDRADSSGFKVLVDKIRTAIIEDTPIDLNGDASLCVNWNDEGKCIAVGSADRSDFTMIKNSFPGLIEINFCRIYNNFYGCDLCDQGRAFNGNECAPCDPRGIASKGECEYPWRSIFMQDDSDGSGNQRRSGLGLVWSQCRLRVETKSWDSCLRNISNNTIPRHMNMGVTPAFGHMNVNIRGMWAPNWRLPFNPRRYCRTNGRGHPNHIWCYCMATNNINTCTQCAPGFMLYGKVRSGMGYEFADNDSDTSIYSHFKCIRKWRTQRGCYMVRHNRDQRSNHSCLVCDYRNGYKMDKEGKCVR